MEPIKINVTTPVNSQKPLNIVSLIERDNELLITVANKECYDIYSGQVLTFTRTVYEDEKLFYTISEQVTVLNEDDKHIIHTTLLPTHRVALEKDIRVVSGSTENGEKYIYHILKTKGPHRLYPQDTNAGTQEIYIKDYQGNILATYSGNSISTPLRREDRVAEIEDCLTQIDIDETCGKIYEELITYRYDYAPEKISTDTLIISGFDESIVNNMVYMETKYNPFYYYHISVDEEGTPNDLDEYGKPIKRCALYKDTWWDALQKRVSVGEKYVNNGNNGVILSYNTYYWNINVGLGTSYDDTTLGSEDYFSTSFVKDKEDSLIPDIIDMERLKYSPMVYDSDGGLSVATAITMNLHFRQRNRINTEDDEIELRERRQNTALTSGHVYTDGWYINPDETNTTWWNGLDCNDSGFSETVAGFIDASGLTSDLMGYLNFVDDDIYYRKKKVSQSFIRLTFYNSPDPLEQKLLYHSTIFLDSTALYGKYIKQMMFMKDNDLFNTKKYNNLNLNAAVVFCSANTVSSRLDTQIVITNEYDRTKSSEGFNLYLFAEDKNYIIENGEKTIYMKVEFNHAGNGKTLPMIMWPKFYWDANLQNEDNTKGGYRYTDEYQPLTISNFMRALYIPIKLTYINDRYVYYIPDAYNNESGNIDLVLFEPKLDYPDIIEETDYFVDPYGKN